MINKIYYKPKDRTEWLRLRIELVEMGMIGGTDVATILDANPWRHAIELFYTSIGYTPNSVMLNEKMAWGIELEEKIAQMYRYMDLQTGDVVANYEAGIQVNPVRNVNAIITNTDYPFLFANIDKYLADIDGIGEIKNMVGFVLDAYDEENEHILFTKCPIGVPVGYYAQLQQYMLVCGKKKGRFIFNRDGCQLIIHDIEEDKQLQQVIVDRSEAFGLKVREGRRIMEEEKDDHKRIQLLTALEPLPDDSESYNKFKTQQILQREIDIAEGTMIGTKALLKAGLAYRKANYEETEAKRLKTESGNFLKAEFFKNEKEKFVFDDDKATATGTIGFKKRLSVKLTDNNG